MSERTSPPPSSGQRWPLSAMMREQRRRWQKGEPVLLESLLSAHPNLKHQTGPLLDLLYHEILLREEAGEHPCLEEYQQRFPELGRQLQDHFEVHAALRTAVQSLLTDRSSVPELRAVPGYEILGLLGRGGMGVVYKARHLSLKRVVALKMILASSGPHERARFLLEAEVVAKLQHPNIVQLFEVGEHAGCPYFAMEYLDGGSLAEHLRTGPPPPRIAARLVEVLARAVAHAHHEGIIHRDLKPANVLLGGLPSHRSADSGTAGILTAEDCLLSAKIVDFGLSTSLVQMSNLTHSGMVLGTPSYMAPEQTQSGSRVGATVDVYALGAILYECLTGQPPFQGKTVLETLDQVRDDDPVPPRKLRPTVPRDLETICLKCLQKDPRQRYATASGLAEDLRRFQAGEPVTARGLGAIGRILRWCGRHPVEAVLVSVLLLLLALGAIGGALSSVWLRHQRDLARDAERWATAKLWQSYLDQARLGRHSTQAGRRGQSLNLLTEAGRIRLDPQLRNEAISCLAWPDLRLLRAWEGNPAVGPIACDPPLRRYARCEGKFVCIRSLEDDRVLARLLRSPSLYMPDALQFSPDGHYLAVSHVLQNLKKECRVWDTERAVTAWQSPLARPGASMAFSCDGRRLAVAHMPDLVVIHETATGRELQRLSGLPAVEQLAFHPDNSRLALSSVTDQLVEVRELETGRTVFRQEVPSGVRALAWSPNGALLAAGADEGVIHVWQTDANRLWTTLRGHASAVIQLTFHRAGKLLISGSWDDSCRFWDLGGGQQHLSTSGSGVSLCTENERLLIRDSTRLTLWELEVSRACQLLSRLPGALPNSAGADHELLHPGGAWGSRLDIGHNGQLLAMTTPSGVELWSLATCQPLAFLPAGPSGAVRFQPGGRLLVTHGRAGLQRWPVRWDGKLTVGPAERLPLPPHRRQLHQLDWDSSGRFLAANDAGRDKVAIFDLEQIGEPALLGDHPYINWVALSPDGRWVAAGTWQHDGVKVWERTTGRVVRTMPGSRSGANSVFVAFSPDGKWLATSGQGECRFWRVGTWEPGWVLPRDRVEAMPAPLAFTHDGRTLAIARARDRVQLFEVASGREYATLPTVAGQPVCSLCFTPDGSRLAVASANSPVQLWDLRLLRQQLDARRLAAGW